MYKKSLIVILCIMFCFCAVNCYANGNAYGHDNPQNPHYSGDDSTIINNYYNETTNNDIINHTITNNEYSDTTNNYTCNSNNTTVNNYDIDNECNYDQSQTTITNNHITIDNAKVENNLAIHQHTDINNEANTLLSTRLADVKYGGVAIAPPEVNPNVIYSTYTTLHFNPSEVVAKLNPGEFSRFNIYVTSDRPIKLYLSANRSNIKILDSVITIDKPDGVAQAGVIVSLEKGAYWTDGLIIFKSELGIDLGQIRVVFENKKAIDHVSRVTMDDTFTTLGHGVRQNRGTWGWSGFVGVRVNRETNKETVYGTLTYDW